jgi:hypothetical protein
MTIHLTPWQHLCRCRLHDRSPRTIYDDPGCTCTITCATQPITLLTAGWDCALFLDYGRDLWYVPALRDGFWDWANPGLIDSQFKFYEDSLTIKHQLRASAHVLASTRP